MKFEEYDQLVESVGLSPPSRGAWIEIFYKFCGDWPFEVAPLAGGVD